MRRIHSIIAAAAVSALLATPGCSEEAVPASPPPPLGMQLQVDGVTYAGAATVDITPSIDETYTDLNGNNVFDGCLDQPSGGTEECPEPFADANGNGSFDAVWMGGFSPMRPALSVSDPLSVRALVVAHDGQYVALVAADVVGLGSPRIHAARDRLAADGFSEDRLIVASTHNHQGPDTMGLWGNPYDLGNPVTGIREAYQQRVTDAIEQAVRLAAAAMKPVTMKVGATRMRDRSPYFNGAPFGGKNPSRRMHGMINDIRDPVVVSDQLLVMQGIGRDGNAVFTHTVWSGHPETWGGDNTAISSDWPGVMREVLESEYGGVAIHMPESLGGMQSALGGDLPLVRDDGAHVYATCTQEDVADPADVGCFGKGAGETRQEQGVPVPVWAQRDSREFVVSHGHHIAEAVVDVLASASTYPASPIEVEAEPMMVPVHNMAYNLLGPSGIFDLGLKDAIMDPDLCPEAGSGVMGCIETRTFRVRIGPVGMATAPGEIMPELAHGLPSDDPEWNEQSAQLQARGESSRYFPQHDPDCNTQTSFDKCRFTLSQGDCDCLKLHTFPYALSSDASMPPVLDMLNTEYRVALSMVDSYMSYIIPEPDVNRTVSLLSDDDGDHYEDTVTVSWAFASRWQEAQRRISERTE